MAGAFHASKYEMGRNDMPSPMKSRLAALLLAMTALTLAPAAGHAATAGDISVTQTLNTSPLWADAQSYWACNVVNVTTSPITVTTELISASGSVIATSGATSIPAGTSTELDQSPGTGFARCRFALNNPADAIRANMTIFHSLGGGLFQTYATSEAR
jgi:hypothetical protein